MYLFAVEGRVVRLAFATPGEYADLETFSEELVEKASVEKRVESREIGDTEAWSPQTSNASLQNKVLRRYVTFLPLCVAFQAQKLCF